VIGSDDHGSGVEMRVERKQRLFSLRTFTIPSSHCGGPDGSGGYFPLRILLVREDGKTRFRDDGCFDYSMVRGMLGFERDMFCGTFGTVFEMCFVRTFCPSVQPVAGRTLLEGYAFGRHQRFSLKFFVLAWNCLRVMFPYIHFLEAEKISKLLIWLPTSVLFKRIRGVVVSQPTSPVLFLRELKTFLGDGDGVQDVYEAARVGLGNIGGSVFLELYNCADNPPADVVHPTFLEDERKKLFDSLGVASDRIVLYSLPDSMLDAEMKKCEKVEFEFFGSLYSGYLPKILTKGRFSAPIVHEFPSDMHPHGHLFLTRSFEPIVLGGGSGRSFKLYRGIERHMIFNTIRIFRRLYRNGLRFHTESVSRGRATLLQSDFKFGVLNYAPKTPFMKDIVSFLSDLSKEPSIVPGIFKYLAAFRESLDDTLLLARLPDIIALHRAMNFQSVAEFGSFCYPFVHCTDRRFGYDLWKTQMRGSLKAVLTDSKDEGRAQLLKALSLTRRSILEQCTSGHSSALFDGLIKNLESWKF
jgi:hypothetical protein